MLNLKAGGLGNLGSEQLEWLEKDVSGLKSSAPIVVFFISPCGQYIRNGAGEPTIASRRCLPEAIWLRDRFERTHSPDDAVEEHRSARRARRPSAAAARHGRFARPDEVPAERLSSVLGITVIM